MAGIGDRTKWVGIRPTNPPENIPVEVKVLVNTPIVPSSPEEAIPVKGSWKAQGAVYVNAANPASDDIHLDTGQLSVGYYDFVVSISCTVNHSYFILEHRNAANDGNVHRIYFLLSAYKQMTLYLNSRSFAANERLRVHQLFNITGRLEGGLWFVQRA